MAVTYVLGTVSFAIILAGGIFLILKAPGLSRTAYSTLDSIEDSLSSLFRVKKQTLHKVLGFGFN